MGQRGATAGSRRCSDEAGLHIVSGAEANPSLGTYGDADGEPGKLAHMRYQLEGSVSTESGGHT